MTIDAHQQFWDPGAVSYPWTTEDLTVIRRPFAPDDLRPSLAATGIERTIVVQARHDVEETRGLLALAAVTNFIAGVIGWVDLTRPSVAEDLVALRALPGGSQLVGIRHQVPNEPDPAWLVREDVLTGIEAVGEAGLTFDLLVRERELPAAEAVARHFPDMRFVLDHCGKPPVASGAMPDGWCSGIRRLAALPNVWCKLSGLVTEADWSAWCDRDLRPYSDAAFAAFGPQRILFGSDWPACLLAAPYERVVQAARALVNGAVPDEALRAGVFGANAAQAYALRARVSAPG